MADNTEVAVIDSVQVAQNNVENLYQQIDRLGGRAGIYSTAKMESASQRLDILRAVSNSDNLSEIAGKEITVKDIVIQAVDMSDQRTGEMQTVPRVVFILTDGTTRHAISKPLFRDVKTLMGLVDISTDFPDGLPLRMVQEGKAPNAYFTLKY